MNRRRCRIIFDLDDTLIPNSWLYNESIWECGLIISRALKQDCPYATELMERQGAVDKERVKTLHFNVNRFPGSWVMLYRQLALESGQMPSATVEQLLQQTAAKFTQGPFWPYRDVPDVLDGLEADGHSLYLVTAGPKDFQNQKIDEAGLRHWFDLKYIFTPEEDKQESLEQIIGSDSPNCVMIGDSLKGDILPAKALKARTIWKRGSTWKYANETLVDPDFVITAMREVPAIIDHISRQA